MAPRAADELQVQLEIVSRSPPKSQIFVEVTQCSMPMLPCQSFVLPGSVSDRYPHVLSFSSEPARSTVPLPPASRYQLVVQIDYPQCERAAASPPS